MLLGIACPGYPPVMSLLNRRGCQLTLPLLLVVACSPAPIVWSADRTEAPAEEAALAPDGGIVIDTLLRLASRLTPPSAACAASLRLARAGQTLFAVWWAPRADSSVVLLSSRSTDGGTSWRAIAPVDTTDRSMTGCHRSPPGVAADSASGYVHVTYALLSTEGPGLFFAHSMDSGATFHTPVPILYGERLGRSSVAASGDLVVVAFEDPNSSSPRVGLALSRTMGHIFEDRMLPVSDDNGRATEPLVSLVGHRIAIAWQERKASSGRPALRVRTGNVR